jgi:hypothetical protein
VNVPGLPVSRGDTGGARKPARKTEPPEDSISLNIRTELPTIWVDNLRGSVRVHPDLMILSFFHGVPGMPERFECARVMTTHIHAKEMVDLMCWLLDFQVQLGHYPKLMAKRRRLRLFMGELAQPSIIN